MTHKRTSHRAQLMAATSDSALRARLPELCSTGCNLLRLYMQHQNPLTSDPYRSFALRLLGQRPSPLPLSDRLATVSPDLGAPYGSRRYGKAVLNDMIGTALEARFFYGAGSSAGRHLLTAGPADPLEAAEAYYRRPRSQELRRMWGEATAESYGDCDVGSTLAISAPQTRADGTTCYIVKSVHHVEEKIREGRLRAAVDAGLFLHGDPLSGYHAAITE